MRVARHLRRALLLAVFGLLASGQAIAGELYLSGQTGTSIGSGTVSGTNTFAGFRNSGEDSDSSPVLGGAIGFEFLLGDTMSRDVKLPKSIPWKIKLPNFGVRFELEGIGARDYELTTDGFTPMFLYHAEVSSFSIMVNNWLDLPVYPIVNKLFGRVPGLVPLKLFFGGGMGYSRTELSATDNLVRGKDTSNNFAYQFGGGLGYDLTERFTVTAGYRYLDSGSTEIDLVDSAGRDSGDFQVDMSSHEVLAALRVDFFSLPWPSRSSRQYDW